MSACAGCYFHEAGQTSNGCRYFRCEYYSEPDECSAFSVDGKLSAEAEDRVFTETGGMYGRPAEKTGRKQE